MYILYKYIIQLKTYKHQQLLWSFGCGMSKVDLWQASRGGRRWYGIFGEKKCRSELHPMSLTVIWSQWLWWTWTTPAYQIDQTIRHKRAGSAGQDDMVGFPKIFSENMWECESQGTVVTCCHLDIGTSARIISDTTLSHPRPWER